MTTPWNKATEELDKIVKDFDNNDVSVDDLFEKLARATELIEELSQRLLETKAKVAALTLPTSATTDEG
jgi:exodeoxyribonuclease VII small subunit